MKNMGASTISLMELASTDENLWSTNLDTIRDLMDRSGLSENSAFLLAFAKEISSLQKFASLLNEFGGVTAERGSIRIRFRDYITKATKEFHVEAARLLELVQKRKQAILSSFHQIGEWAWVSTVRPVLHAGICAAALILVVVSLWFAMTHGVVTALQVVAENLLSSFKSALPLILSIVWWACLIYEIATSRELAIDPVYRQIQEMFGKP